MVTNVYTEETDGVILIKPYRKLHSEAVARRYSEKKVF